MSKRGSVLVTPRPGLERLDAVHAGGPVPEGPRIASEGVEDMPEQSQDKRAYNVRKHIGERIASTIRANFNMVPPTGHTTGPRQLSATPYKAQSSQPLLVPGCLQNSPIDGAALFCYTVSRQHAGHGKEQAHGMATPDQIWDERGIGPLIKTLDAHDPDLRRSAALALGHIQDPRVAEPLIKALRDPDPEVRRWAVLGLGRLGDLSAIPEMINVLRETGASQRAAAADALAMIGAPAIPTLAAALRYHLVETQCAAAGVLGRIADARALSPLIHALRSPELRLRMAAATALAAFASSSQGPEVRAALPPLRRLAWQEEAAFYRRVIQRIEQATASLAPLPIPAEQPVPPIAHLPLPAQSPLPLLEGLPIPTDSPSQDKALASPDTPRSLPFLLRLLRKLLSFRGARQ